uniref:tRNA(Ile)-lysidine synthase, chloroplastic n=1 Tax=Chondria tumulosa TaxID=2740715 RepID=A0A896SPR8_9FLOR|nr:tRNAIle-lysidine synthetase [Chondria tumulosa]QSD57052.1 tRNAIle-lysidine synthetase [Chondria tumulosa]
MKKKKKNQLNHTDDIVIKQELLNKTLVAISGGQDSLYLINLIENIKNQTITKKNRKKISYIYIDHQWRKDSYKQIIHIINYIKSINGNIFIYQLNRKIVSEKLCRIYRYHIIFQHAIKYNYRLIITGHNKTDKVETFLHHFFHGYGIEGITSLISNIKLNQNISLLRPLLKVNRENIYWTCKKYYLPIWSDTTNYTYHIYRNRIRYELIPYLKKYFHQNIENNIYQVLTTHYNQNEYIKQNTIKLYLTSKHKKYIALNYSKLNNQNFILQFKTIQLFCIKNTNCNLQYHQILKIIINNKQNIQQNYLRVKLKYCIFHINKNWIYLTL